MNRTISLLIALMAAPLAESHAQAPKQAADGGLAVASRVDEFLTEPLFVPMQQLWEKRGGWGGILTAKDGTVVAFQSPGGGTCRRSRDGGITWDAEIPIASEARNGRGLADETTGDVLYVNPGAYSTLAVGRSGTPQPGKDLPALRRRSEKLGRGRAGRSVQPELAARRSRHHVAARKDTVVRKCTSGLKI
jgi:hypothetical protein